MIKLQKEHILISIKDQGIEFNSIIVPEGSEFKNTDISDNMEYSRVLGLNCTVIKIIYD